MLTNKKYISIKLRKTKLRDRSNGLSFLVEVSNFLAASMNFDDLLNDALSKVLDYFDVEAGRIYFMDDEGLYLNLAACQGIQPYGLEKVNINEGYSGKAVRTRSFIAQHVSELEDKNRKALLQGKGYRTIICVPLIYMDKVGGVMNLATSKETIDLSEGKIELLTAVGNQIAIAADNAKLYKDLQHKIQILEEKKKMIKYFAYSVSHDLKSPAIGLYGLTRRLQERYAHTLDVKGRSYCDQILTTAERMVALLEKVNGYIVSKESILSFEKIKLKEVTETIRNEFLGVLKERRIIWSEPEVLPEITADRLSLSRVFQNLVENALKYGGDKVGEIKIGHKENETFHILSVSDNGVGIKDEDKEDIFELFQRHETSRGTAGSGIGLAIVKEIAKKHQGSVWVENGRKKWTTFSVSISKNLDPLPSIERKRSMEGQSAIIE